MEIEDESLGSTIAGWAETAAANAAEVPAAIVATYMDLSLPKSFYVPLVTVRGAEVHILFHPNRDPPRPTF